MKSEVKSYSTVCCDASLVMRLFDDREVEHITAIDLWQDWSVKEVKIIAPLLLRYEVTNATYRLVRFGQISQERGEEILGALHSLPIRYIDTFEMHLRSFRFARRFDSRTSYDGHYVALAEHERVPLITADKKLVNTAHHHYDFIHYVMDI